MKNDHDTWVVLKKKIDALCEQQTNFPIKQEVWMCALGKNIGFEQNGGGDNFSRPVLVIKKLNNKMYWIVPLSSKQKPFDFYYNFKDMYNKNVSVIIAQIKLVSIKRMQRKMYVLDNVNFTQIKSRLVSILDQ